ncbi:MAG: hypothetical protein CVU49_05865 [Candidatus Cloacimonetes bacterium HGW-Cloacimonetes-2]|nr:MAG: hypothetical protein CVU49_05865 [Candidatus Cloacimonetes bacterium HGW-Cloacimonetes-2]
MRISPYLVGIDTGYYLKVMVHTRYILNRSKAGKLLTTKIRLILLQNRELGFNSENNRGQKEVYR